MQGAKRYHIKVIYCLFFMSGISGLIFETVWLRMLSRTLGNTVWATAVVLAAFMAGLALGSLILGRYGDRLINGMKLYALLELLIGISALCLTLALNELTPLYQLIHALTGGERFWLAVFQSLLMFFLLVIPTSLMGGTLPILIAYARLHDTKFICGAGYLYGLNTLGALLGVVGSGIFTIGFFGEKMTLLMGVLLNLIVCLAASSLSRVPLSSPPSEEMPNIAVRPLVIQQPVLEYSDAIRKLALIAYFFNGFVAMSYEIIWMRIFQIEVGTSVYAFSTMLAFFLLGIGTGSIVVGTLGIKVRNTLRLFGALQIFIALYSLIGLYLFTLFSPFESKMLINLNNMLVMPLLVVFPITFVFGMLFPLVAQSFVGSEDQTGRDTGFLYFMNTLGCIAGSISCGFFLIDYFGTRGTMLFLAGVNFLIGIAVYYSTSKASVRTHATILAVMVLLLTVGYYSPDPFLYAAKEIISRVYKQRSGEVGIFYHKEASAATTTAFGIRKEGRSRSLLVNGIGMTSLAVEAKLMSHIPILAV